MSGPPYPPGSQPGSNAIGSFTIGVSPIGDIPSFNFWTTVISQYANSPIITQLLSNFSQYIDPTQNFDSFYDLMWNVDTAQGYGLDVWGRIVGVTRILSVASSTVYFGFNEAVGIAGIGTFGQGTFFAGTPLTNAFALTDSAFRTLIFAKALANISDGSIKSINQLLLNLFRGRGSCYVTDGQNMTMTYSFQFGLTAVEFAIVSSSGVLPKSVGVTATVVQV